MFDEVGDDKLVHAVPPTLHHFQPLIVHATVLAMLVLPHIYASVQPIPIEPTGILPVGLTEDIYSLSPLGI